MLIDHIRVNSHANTYAASMSAPIVQQIISSLRLLQGSEGEKYNETKKNCQIHLFCFC